MDHLEFITALLEKGANPNARIKDNTLTRTIFTMQWFLEDGSTPFIRAAQSGDTALMKLLLEYKADPKIATTFGDTALTAAAGIGWVPGVTYERSVKENVEAMRMLLDLGLDPNGANNDGRTALMGAAMKGRNDVVQLLVSRGADLDTRDHGSRDTDKATSAAAGHRWQAIDYADGLVRVGVQSAVEYPETSALIRKLMEERDCPRRRTIATSSPSASSPSVRVTLDSGRMDERLLAAAIDLARQARAAGNHPFGALLAIDGQIVLTAQNTVHTDRDPTAHAETNLVAAAIRSLSTEQIHAAVLYTSCEPCAMCVGKMYWAGIRSIVYALSAADLAKMAGGDFLIQCRTLFSRAAEADVDVKGPLLVTEARAVHLGMLAVAASGEVIASAAVRASGP